MKMSTAIVAQMGALSRGLFDEAKEACASVGSRICTLREVMNHEAYGPSKDGGCGDVEDVWTSDFCTTKEGFPGRKVQPTAMVFSTRIFPEDFSPDQCLRIDNDDARAGVRCCADADTEEAIGWESDGCPGMGCKAGNFANYYHMKVQGYIKPEYNGDVVKFRISRKGGRVALRFGEQYVPFENPASDDRMGRSYYHYSYDTQDITIGAGESNRLEIIYHKFRGRSSLNIEWNLCEGSSSFCAIPYTSVFVTIPTVQFWQNEYIKEFGTRVPPTRGFFYGGRPQQNFLNPWEIQSADNVFNNEWATAGPHQNGFWNAYFPELSPPQLEVPFTHHPYYGNGLNFGDAYWDQEFFILSGDPDAHWRDSRDISGCSGTPGSFDSAIGTGACHYGDYTWSWGWGPDMKADSYEGKSCQNTKRVDSWECRPDKLKGTGMCVPNSMDNNLALKGDKNSFAFLSDFSKEKQTSKTCKLCGKDFWCAKNTTFSSTFALNLTRQDGVRREIDSASVIFEGDVAPYAKGIAHSVSASLRLNDVLLSTKLSKDFKASFTDDWSFPQVASWRCGSCTKIGPAAIDKKYFDKDSPEKEYTISMEPHHPEDIFCGANLRLDFCLQPIAPNITGIEMMTPGGSLSSLQTSGGEEIILHGFNLLDTDGRGLFVQFGPNGRGFRLNCSDPLKETFYTQLRCWTPPGLGGPYRVQIFAIGSQKVSQPSPVSLTYAPVTITSIVPEAGPSNGGYSTLASVDGLYRERILSAGITVGITAFFAGIPATIAAGREEATFEITVPSLMSMIQTRVLNTIAIHIRATTAEHGELASTVSEAPSQFRYFGPSINDIFVDFDANYTNITLTILGSNFGGTQDAGNVTICPQVPQAFLSYLGIPQEDCWVPRNIINDTDGTEIASPILSWTHDTIRIMLGDSSLGENAFPLNISCERDNDVALRQVYGRSPLILSGSPQPLPGGSTVRAIGQLFSTKGGDQVEITAQYIDGPSNTRVTMVSDASGSSSAEDEIQLDTSSWSRSTHTAWTFNVTIPPV